MSCQHKKPVSDREKGFLNKRHVNEESISGFLGG